MRQEGHRRREKANAAGTFVGSMAQDYAQPPAIAAPIMTS